MNKRALDDFHTRLHAWYAEHGRHDLPWRNTSDPYAIWLSEIMLQQTQVATVLSRYYAPFLTRFPTIQSLASAPLADVLKAWEGLGYYSRARNLHRAAQLASGGLPRTVEELLKLPGIGRNTAHAVAAFAYHAPAAVMEANVKRVLCRIFALRDADTQTLWTHAAALLDANDPFNYNQAMMDIGAMICTPRSPRCDICPAVAICRGKINPQAYPEKRTKKATPVRIARIIIARDAKGRIYATPRTSAFLHGLYRFIELPLPSSSESHSACADSPSPDRKKSRAANGVRLRHDEAMNNIPLNDSIPLGAFTQTYSHFTLQAETFLVSIGTEQDAPHWHTPEALAFLPRSRAEDKAMALLEAYDATQNKKPRRKGRG